MNSRALAALIQASRAVEMFPTRICHSDIFTQADLWRSWEASASMVSSLCRGLPRNLSRCLLSCSSEVAERSPGVACRDFD